MGYILHKVNRETKKEVVRETYTNEELNDMSIFEQAVKESYFKDVIDVFSTLFNKSIFPQLSFPSFPWYIK